MNIRIFELPFKLFCQKAINLMSLIAYVMCMDFVIYETMWVAWDPFRAFLFPVKNTWSKWWEEVKMSNITWTRESNWFTINCPLPILGIHTKITVSTFIFFKFGIKFGHFIWFLDYLLVPKISFVDHCFLGQ